MLFLFTTLHHFVVQGYTPTSIQEITGSHKINSVALINSYNGGNFETPSHFSHHTASIALLPHVPTSFHLTHHLHNIPPTQSSISPRQICSLSTLLTWWLTTHPPMLLFQQPFLLIHNLHPSPPLLPSQQVTPLHEYHSNQEPQHRRARSGPLLPHRLQQRSRPPRDVR